MRKPSGELHIVDYKTQQIIASLKPSEYVEDIRHWELQNNVDTLDVTILETSKFAPYMQQQNLILKETRPGVIIPYVITETDKDSTDKTLKVFASGEWILMDADDFIKPQKFESRTPEQYIDFATKNTDWERGIVEVTGKRTMTAKEFVSPLGLISQLPGLFEKKGELRYRVEIRGANTIKRKVDFIERRGRDNGKEVTVGKDLNRIRRTENSEAIITALIPYVMGENEDGSEKIITIESVNNGVPYIVDEDAYQRWNRNGKHRFGFYTPETDNKDMTPARLLQLGKTEIKKRIDTIVSYEVDAVDISRIPGFEHEAVNEGDTIRIKDITLTPPLYLEARVIAGDESFKDNRATKYKFGNYREIVDPNAELRRLYQRILSSLGDKVPKELFDELANRVGNTELTSEEAKKAAEKAEKESQTAKDLAEATADYVEQNTANVIEQPTAPTEGLKDGKTIWVDNSDPNNRVMKLWKDGNWVRITPDTKPLEEAARDLQDAVSKAEQDINKLKQEVIEIPDVVFKDGRFTDMKLTVEQTEEALTQKAEKTEINQLSDGLTEVKQTVNTVKQTSEENTATITKIEGSINNENHLYDSSADHVLPKFIIGNDPVSSHFHQATHTFENDYTTMVCTNNQDSFFQIGDYLQNDLRGFDVLKDITISADLSAETSTVEIVVFQYVSGQWTAPTRKFVETVYDWRRLSYTFQLDVKCKAWMFRIRFPQGAESDGKKIWFRNLKVEKGSFATPWSNIQISQQEITKKTNEIKQTVDENTQKITSVETKVSNINDNVTNLMIQSGTFEGALTRPDRTNRWWLKNDTAVRIAEDTFMSNRVAETQSAWQGIAYNFADLVRRKVVKTGDILNYSIYTRIKGLPSGEKRHSFYFTGSKTGTEMVPVTSEWSRSSVSFEVTANMMNIEGWNTEDWLRVEIWEGLAGDQWYQQASPQITVGDKVYTWRAAPEDTNHAIQKTNEIKQTVDENIATISKVQKDQGTMQTTLNEVKQTTDSNSQTITTLTQTQGQHGDIIQQNTSAITQLNNQISLKVSEKQMEDYVGTIGEPNLILNAPFRWKEINQYGDPIQDLPSIDKWGTYTVDTSKGKFEPVVQPQYGGENSINIYCADFHEDKSWTGINQVIGDVDINSDYTYRAMVYTTNKNSIDDGLYAEIKAFNGNKLVGAVGSNINEVIENGVWKEFVVTLPAMKIAVTHLQITCGVRRNGSIYMSNPMFQKGTTKSVFIPNTKDMGDYNAMVREIGKKVATSEFNQKVTTMQTAIEQNTQAINLRAVKEEVYTKQEANGTFGDKAMVERHESQINLNSEQIDLRVKSGDIASTINQTAQAVLIQAEKINLRGAVTADSIKSGRLDGVVITTADLANSPYWMKLEKQNLSLIETKSGADLVRGYLGFVPLDNSVVRTALVLGNNYNGTNQVDIAGTLFVEQRTPKFGDNSLMDVRIGMADSRNGNDINYKSLIKMGYMGDIRIDSGRDVSFFTKGHFKVDTTQAPNSLQDINMRTLSSMKFEAYSGVYGFHSRPSKGADDYRTRTVEIHDRRARMNEEWESVDIKIADRVILRVPNHDQYTKYGVEFNNGSGSALQNIRVDKVYLTQNMWESTKQVKTAIKDIQVDALETLMELKPKQYHRKNEMAKLYAKRSAIVEGGYKEPMPTIKDVPMEYGFIAEDMPDCLATDDRKAVSAYPLVTMSIASQQKIRIEQLADRERIETLEETVKAQATQLATQENRIAKLEELLLRQLINKKPEQQ
ncbi:phage tail spike protein [Bacillus mycoides]|uniref:phage tail spike protein n=1 Tax=Bacillus mycoides TaxID=1405 RepID=UPI001C035E23|nr:phage tail spike protein [Bacillus mycoides]QWI52525.1 hypothetical protein EXW56_27080 [Bacillus mycoides]